MTLAAVFSDEARAEVLGRAEGRCSGCGRTEPMTVQHRRARGMGGTSRVELGHPANGLALHGSGTTGCHGWTERHPLVAGLLGWRLGPDDDPRLAPYWCSTGWSWNRVGDDGSRLYVDVDDLPDRDAREAAVRTFLRWRDAARR